MKKIALIAALLMVTVGTYAQGTLNFRNRFTASNIDSPFRQGGVNISGANWTVELLVGTSQNNLTSVTTSGLVASASGAGYVNKLGVVVPGIAGGAAAFAQIRVWDTTSGATYDAASIKGASDVFAVTLGGGGSPPGPANELSGLAGFGPISVVPEPSTLALAVLGGLAFMFRRRK